MSRQEILAEIQATLGLVPGWLEALPTEQLAHEWPRVRWELTDTALTAREKALVGFGAAAASHCPY